MLFQDERIRMMARQAAQASGADEEKLLQVCRPPLTLSWYARVPLRLRVCSDLSAGMSGLRMLSCGRQTTAGSATRS